MFKKLVGIDKRLIFNINKRLLKQGDFQLGFLKQNKQRLYLIKQEFNNPHLGPITICLLFIFKIIDISLILSSEYLSLKK